MRIFILSTLLMLAFAANAQIKGIVKDEQGKPLSGATVMLKKAKDSSVVKFHQSKADGTYQFDAITSGNYFVQVSHVGYGNSSSKAFNLETAEVSVPSFSLNKSSGNLKEVTVTSAKPFVEVKADKTVVNVEGSVNAVGQDALELLRKSPGVMVDKDDNLSLSGKNGVQVYIDGKPTPLGGQDLAQYLKSLQSSSIESIEIITNPSAKYEAAGNAGIINIKLKKNRSLGTNGSVNAGYSVGTFPKYNVSGSLNYRNKKVNIFSNYTYNNNHNESYMFFKRYQLDTLFDLNSRFTYIGQSHNFKTGLDYFIDQKSTIGVMVNGNLNNNTFYNVSITPIYYNPTHTFVKKLVADNSTKAQRNNVNFNLNYKYSDKGGHDLNVDADAGVYRIRTNQWQPNRYYDADGKNYSSSIYNFISPSDINIYSVKADYEQNFHGGKLGFGGKSSYVNTTNDLNRYNIDPTSSVSSYDYTRSNSFDYKEYINALYVNYNKSFKGLMIQAGVRMEQTNIEGISNGFLWNATAGQFQTNQQSFTRSYIGWFPSGAITFNKNPNSQFGLRYSRRIDRPAYQDLNPFEFKLDEYSYMKGNINLRPQYTNSFALTHTYKYKLNTTLSYSHVYDVFTQLIDTTEKSKSFLTKKNLNTQDVVGLNISYPFGVKWYSVFTNFNASYSHYKANLGVGRSVDVDAYTVNIYQQHGAKLGHGYSAEVSGFYNSPSIWQGTFKTTSMWGVDAGILKNLLNDKASIKVAMSDIFNTMHWGATNAFAGQVMVGGGGWESRLVKVNFTYRFGSNQIKAARQRKTSAEEEMQRTNSDGGMGGR